VGLLHRLYLLQATNGFRKWFETRLVMLLAEFDLAVDYGQIFVFRPSPARYVKT
jgi:hypothetical protein